MIIKSMLLLVLSIFASCWILYGAAKGFNGFLREIRTLAAFIIEDDAQEKTETKRARRRYQHRRANL